MCDGSGRDGSGREELARVARELGPLARVGAELGSLTTYRVGGSAAIGVDARSPADLLAVRRALRGGSLPVLVVGRGSNMLVADAGFAGVAVHLGGEFAELTIGPHDGPEGGAVVRAGGAVGLPVLPRKTVEAGLGGLEWAVGVPGSVGGGLRMNAGGHGSDIAATLVRYGWVDLSAPAGGASGPERLALGYRSSSVSESQAILWAEFLLAASDRAHGRATIAEIVRWRREHQPGGANAGSVFVNPEGDSAGRLVELSGMKGHRHGSAHVSEKHANFIMADQGGSADDVVELIELVRAAVARTSGVVLRTEVRLVGFAASENGTEQ